MGIVLNKTLLTYTKMQNIFRKSTLALVATALMGTMANAEAELTLDEGVLVLTDANFDEQVKKHETGLLVEFYAPWCGHCKSLAPEYASAAQALAKKSPPRFVGKVDATVHEKIAKRFGVEGYPTLKWFSNGNNSEYGGGRTSDTIVSWIMKKTGPPSETLACADLEATVKNNKISMVLFGEQTTPMGASFIKTAQSNDKATFYHTTADCASANGASADGVNLYRNFDEPRVAYAGATEEKDITEFIKANSVASLFKFSDDSVEAIFHNSSPAIVYFSDGEPPASFVAASKAMKGKILFTYSGVSDGIQEQLGEFVGVSKEEMPCIRIIKPSEAGVTKFKYEGAMDAVTAESLSEFVTPWVDGKLVAFRKTEDVPAKNDEPVRVLVGKTFEEEVTKSENEVLVKFYAPWCGHCAALAPHWTSLAEDVKAVNGLVIAKYDSTKNENEGVEVESFPTLKFFNKDNKTNGGMEVKYNHADGKQVASLKNYLRKNSAAYKSARPDEKIEEDDFKDEAPAEEEGGEAGGEGGEEPKEGEEEDMTEEQMKKMEEDMRNMTPEEKAKMDEEMKDMEKDPEMNDVPGGEPKGEEEAPAADAKKEDL